MNTMHTMHHVERTFTPPPTVRGLDEISGLIGVDKFPHELRVVPGRLLLMGEPPRRGGEKPWCCGEEALRDKLCCSRDMPREEPRDWGRPDMIGRLCASLCARRVSVSGSIAEEPILF